MSLAPTPLPKSSSFPGTQGTQAAKSELVRLAFLQWYCFWCVHSPSSSPPPPPVFNTRLHHVRNAQKPKATHQAAPTPALRRAQSCGQGLTCPLAHSLGPASQTHKRTTELRTGDTTTHSVLSAQRPLLVATYTEPLTLPVHVAPLHWVLWIQEQILQ